MWSATVYFNFHETKRFGTYREAKEYVESFPPEYKHRIARVHEVKTRKVG
jgi:hypothetical protein